jgi:hydrogenase/urease accessory protein HupE
VTRAFAPVTRAFAPVTRAFALPVLGAALLAASAASAHEVRPALLELRETGVSRWDVQFRVPARGELRLALDLRLPDDCAQLAPARPVFVDAMVVERYEVRCAEPLAGREVAIDGLASTMVDVIVRVEREDGGRQTARVVPAEPRFTVEAAPGRLGVAATYLGLGVEHILLGVDHLLFVLALVLLVEGTRRLVETITAFTAAHSLSLAAATLGLVHVPPPPVEAVISLSIVFLACEIVHARRGRPGLAERRPWLVAFTFGLLHGLGFAGALAEVGLPEQAIPLALLFFNVGVEAGQLLFIAAVLTSLALLARLPARRLTRAWWVPAYAIGGVAAYWTLARVAGFFG